mmetsp:Transcript_46495/g.108342  ORF Transcript_46495/g.108342 Transcript_46495/m.108342 type:complete len:189 (-) Transcript_46495:2026-2592(-)
MEHHTTKCQLGSKTLSSRTPPCWVSHHDGLLAARSQKPEAGGATGVSARWKLGSTKLWHVPSPTQFRVLVHHLCLILAGWLFSIVTGETHRRRFRPTVLKDSVNLYERPPLLIRTQAAVSRINQIIPHATHDRAEVLDAAGTAVVTVAFCGQSLNVHRNALPLSVHIVRNAPYGVQNLGCLVVLKPSR